MKGPHSNEQTSLGVLMTPAQKAAAEIMDNLILEGWFEPDTDEDNYFREKFASIIQSAPDAAVEQRKQRELELADSWRNEWSHASNGEVAACALECADELESLVKES